MLKVLSYICIILTAAVPAVGQQLSGRSRGELYQLLRESKPDSERVLILKELGWTYLNQVFNDKETYLIDTAIGIFGDAVRLSDSLQLKDLRYEVMLMQGEAYLTIDSTVEAKKLFSTVAGIYHAKGDKQSEAGTWLRIARRMYRHGENLIDIEAFFDKAIALLKQAQDKEGEAAARIDLAKYLFDIDRFDRSEKELLQALELRHQTGNAWNAHAYYLLSNIGRYQGAYEKALLYATKCVENAERDKDMEDADLFYGELALVNDELGRVEESCYWYRKALAIRIAQKQEGVFIYRTAGFLVRQLIRSKKSRAALALMDSLRLMYPPGSVSEKAVIAQNYAYCFDALQQYPKAEKQLLAMAAYYRSAVPETEVISLANMDIGRFYLQRAQFKKAKAYLDTALANGGSDRMINKRELFGLLFTADSALGDYSAAVKDLQQYQALNDSIYNERKSRQIEELTIQYETEKKQQNILLLEKEKGLQQNELQQVKNTQHWIMGVAILLMVIVGLLINNSRVKQRTNMQLLVQQKQIEKKNNTLQHLVEEKEWLVREIHHRVKNNFQIVIGLLRTQSGYLQGTEAIQAITESKQRIQAMSLVHQKLYQSDNLSAVNIADYIHELIDDLKDGFYAARTIQFKVQIEPVRLNLSHCVPLGLIINEAITNSLKHAFPDNKEGVITVAFKRVMKDRFQLLIKDNGVGLPEDPGNTSQAGMGMKLMRGLSDDVEGVFQINNNHGTEIVLDFTTT